MSMMSELIDELRDKAELYPQVKPLLKEAAEAIEMLSEKARSTAITHEQAIDYLTESGWLPLHDEVLTSGKIEAYAPVVRCRHCEHWNDHDIRIANYCDNRGVCRKTDTITKDCDFCSHGEIKH